MKRNYKNRLPKYARERTPPDAYFNLLPTVQIDILRTILQRSAQSFAAASRRPPAKGKGEKGAKGDKTNGKGYKGKKKPIDALKENE